MPAGILYYITDRHAFPGNARSQREQLLRKIEEACRAGVDYIQFREKDLLARELETLTREAHNIVHKTSLRTESGEPRTALLINSRTDVGLAIGAAGVHLPAADLDVEEVRRVWSSSDAGVRRRAKISVSCHSLEEVHQAAARGADLAIFAPVFEKKDAPGTTPVGLDALRQACKARIPVLALGGVTVEKASACLEAGAAGIAGIRLFQEHDIAQIVARLAR
jgi:thiamine-phosphate pyrophosphorylase